ncbi:hypothetical protein NKW84_16890 [Acetobacter senegalensis]|uniref:AfsA-related hotdog domain-containing protein n=1 Tax=Acetobacter senegalensis TaxID=446692 RepID=UPI0020A0BFC2|nr:AfsA-related hotdog domain-containing protein [Acetobacter senegalensis]MCP1197511.1 hypothetical protein [Acetobacter senegalensis]
MDIQMVNSAAFWKKTSIEPDLLHKNSCDDVLISSPKYALPSILTSAQYHQIIRDTGSEIGKMFVLSPEGGCYIFKYLKNISAVSSERVGIPHQVALRFGVDTQTPQFQETLSALADDIPPFSFTMKNSADHYYFYRKDHEHVPGTMLIEVARQAVYFSTYQTGYERGTVSVSLSALSGDFLTYVELMYPVEITLNLIEEKKEPRFDYRSYRCSFFQRGKRVADIVTETPIIPMNLFQIIRDIPLTPSARFKPLESKKIEVAVTTEKVGTEIIRVSLISLDEIATVGKCSAPADMTSELSLITPGLKKLDIGPAIASDHGHMTVWRPAGTETFPRNIIKEFIKNYCVATGD